MSDDIYEHRIRAIKSAEKAMKACSDPAEAAKAHAASIARAKANERDCGWTPPKKAQ